MATRAARVSSDHVQALNSIDLAFYGRKFFGFRRRTRAKGLVLAAWKEYHDHLGTPSDEDALRIWNVRSDELFTNLLATMATDVGYTFDRVELRKGAYSPKAHGEIEEDQILIRKGVLSVLKGETPLRMEVTSLHVNDEFAAHQLSVNNALKNALEGRGVLTIEIKPAHQQAAINEPR